MNCSQARAALDAAFDNGAAAGAVIMRHLSTCPDCAAHQAVLEALDGSLRQTPSLADDAALVARIQASIAAQPLRRPMPWHFPAAAAAALFLLTGLGWVIDMLVATPVIPWQAWMPQGPLLPDWYFLQQEVMSIPAAVGGDVDRLMEGLAMLWTGARSWTAGTNAMRDPVLWTGFFACLACAGILNSLEWTSRRTHR